MAADYNTISVLDPQYDPAYAAMLLRQKALSDQLMQQSAEPLQGQMVSNHYVAPSWTQGLSKMFQSYEGAKMGVQSSGTLAKMQAAALRNVFANMTGGQQPMVPGANSTALAAGAAGNNPMPGSPPTLSDGTAAPPSMIPPSLANNVGPTNRNAALATALRGNGMPAQDTPAPASASGIPPQALGQIMAGSMLGMPDAYASTILSPYQATDATKMAMAAGVDPRQANEGALTKNNYIPFNILRPGNTILDPLTHQPIFTSPDMDSGAMIRWNNGQPSAMQIPGMSAIQSDLAYQKARGAARIAPAPVTYGQNGRVLPAQTQAQWADQVGSNGPPAIPQNNPAQPGVLGQMGNETLPAPTWTPNWQGNKIGPSPQEQGTLAPQFGVQQGREAQQAELSKKWTDLNSQNSQAQTTTSYLQNIKSLANNAAVGPQSDKRDFVNGLISLLPGVQERATNAVTANDLLDKYSNQIVARLGQGGMGTDAARSILQSAYPGAHMNLPAINEAVDNLVGANEMIKAKTALLSPPSAQRDPIGYQQKEVIFDQNADPRLWQYKSIAGTPQGKIFLQSVLKQDPQFLQKAQALHQIGAF